MAASGAKDVKAQAKADETPQSLEPATSPPVTVADGVAGGALKGAAFRVTPAHEVCLMLPPEKDRHTLRRVVHTACLSEFLTLRDADDTELCALCRDEHERGNASATSNYGWLLLFGVGCDRDERRGVELFAAAAARGCCNAENNAAVCLACGYGDGSPQASTAYAAALTALAGGNGIDAFLFPGQTAPGGGPLPKDEASAFTRLQAAAKTGCLSAITNVGKCYRYGYGVAKDEACATQWYERGARLGFAVAGTYYGQTLEDSGDVKSGFAWYMKAANKGHATAMNNVAICYKQGVGVVSDYKLAVEWHYKAAVLDLPDAFNGLAICFEHALGVPKLPERAFELYERAAYAGYDVAQQNLAICYNEGFGVAKNEHKSLFWRTKAAEQGYTEAAYRLGLVFENATHGQVRNIALALRWYSQAAQAGHYDATAALQRLRAPACGR